VEEIRLRSGQVRGKSEIRLKPEVRPFQGQGYSPEAGNVRLKSEDAPVLRSEMFICGLGGLPEPGISSS